MSRKPDSSLIEVGPNTFASREDFEQSLWHILARDYYGIDDEPDASASKLAEAIREHFSVEIALIIHRPSLSGDEDEVIGAAHSRASETDIVFWASDASGVVGILTADKGENLAAIVARLFTDVGANLCQISGTTILNKRPDLLSRDDLAALIEHLISDQGLGWNDVGDDAETAAEFLERSYDEDASDRGKP